MNYKSFFLSLLLLSGCAYSSDAADDKQAPASYNVSFPKLAVTESDDGSSVVKYQTADGMKVIQLPTSRTYNQELRYFDVNTRSENTNYLSEQSDLNYILGNFTNNRFLNLYPLLQIKLRQDGQQNHYVLEFLFDERKNDFILVSTYQLLYLNYCGHELDSIKNINPPTTHSLLSLINFAKVNQKLFSTDFYKGEKIIPDILLDKYQLLMDKDTPNKQAIVESLIQTNESDDSDRCMPEEYIDALYYYEDNIELSNNLAFYFAQYGYHNEAIELLDSVISSHPKRAVAYLNIADSYHAIGDKTKADEYYKEYYEKMTHLGKQELIPKRVQLQR